MKNIFPGLSIICGTALLIAGNVTSGIIFASLGFLGAIMGAALRHQQEQEALKVMKEFTETLQNSAASTSEVEEVKQSLTQLAGAFGELWGALVSPDTKNDPWGGYNGSGGGGHGVH